MEDFKLKNIVILFFLILLGCNLKTKPNNSINAILSTNKQITQDSTKIGYLDYKLLGNLTKINQKKESEKNVNQWVFKKSSVYNLLSRMKKVEANEAYTKCYQHNSWYEGIVSNGNDTLEMAINSGGYIVLSNKKKTIHFIMEKESSLFTDICNCCEEQE
ncbi:MAG: hypothetical protein ROO71_00045 [Balneola sp.]